MERGAAGGTGAHRRLLAGRGDVPPATEPAAPGGGRVRGLPLYSREDVLPTPESVACEASDESEGAPGVEWVW